MDAVPQVGPARAHRFREAQRPLVGGARRPDALELAAQACVGARQRIGGDGARAATDVPGDDREPPEQREHEGPPEVTHIGRTDPEAAEQIELRRIIELHDVIAPPGVGGIPALQRSCEPGRAAQQPLACRQRIGQQVEDPAAQPLGRDHCGRIDARPAAAFQPDFRPRMGIRLTHQEVVADRIPLPAEIAGHHARRDARGAH